MFYRISSETYAHQCANADTYIAQYRMKMALITMHDGVARLDLAVPTDRIVTHKNHPHTTNMMIDFCPLCGCKLDEDTVSDEWLPKKYNPWNTELSGGE